jgi:predicted methyltransferase
LWPVPRYGDNIYLKQLKRITKIPVRVAHYWVEIGKRTISENMPRAVFLNLRAARNSLGI